MIFEMMTIIKILIIPVVVVLMWKKPIYGIIFFIISLPYLSDMKLLLLEIGIVGFYIIHYIKEGKFQFKYTPANIYLVLFGILIILSTILSIDPQGSFRDFTLHIASLGVIFVFTNSEKNKKDMYIINIFLVIVAVAVSIHGIYQLVQGVPMGSGWVDPARNPNIKTRVYATFENPNLLAEYLIMMFPVSIALFFYNRNLIKKIIFGISSGVILISIAFTYSRGGWIGLFIGTLVFLLLVNRKALLALIPVGMVGILFLPSTIIQRFMTIGNLQDTSSFYRLNLWTKSVDIIKDFWYSGIGIGYIPFQKITPMYIKTMAPYHIHNVFLQTAIEMGIIGVTVFILLIFTLFKMGIKIVSKSESRFVSILMAGYIASLASILTHGMVEHIFFNPKIIMTFWLMVGISINYYVLNRKNVDEIQ